MVENVTNMLLAELLLARDPPQTGDLPRSLARRPEQALLGPSESVHVRTSREQPLNFDTRWWPGAFESELPYWLRPIGTQPPPSPLWLDYTSRNDPWRRRLEEFDREYPGRPLRRR
jgi:hypothetical protein